MNVAMIVPTGLGCEIGGHAGDANPAAKLLGECCDSLILHPNVVNASDINEMPGNALYVEGGHLDNFLSGRAMLRRCRSSNRILLFVNEDTDRVRNAANAAVSTIGCEIEVEELETPISMEGFYGDDGRGTGSFSGVDSLFHQYVNGRRGADAIAVYTPIHVDEETRRLYMSGERKVNPWGGIEAIVSREISERLSLPVAHAPTDDGDPFEEEVDPRLSAEMISFSFLHCVFRGLHKAPEVLSTRDAAEVSGPGRFSDCLTDRDVDALVTPVGCRGHPHERCLERDIPVIAVRENSTALEGGDVEDPDFVVVDSYHEAAGVLMGMRAGVSRRSVRRPLGGVTRR